MYNLPVASVIGGAGAGILFVAWKGIFWGLGGGAAGFILGSWLSEQWFLGNIQRWIYWNIRGQKSFISPNIPESHHRKLL